MASECVLPSGGGSIGDEDTGFAVRCTPTVKNVHSSDKTQKSQIYVTYGATAASFVVTFRTKKKGFTEEQVQAAKLQFILLWLPHLRGTTVDTFRSYYTVWSDYERRGHTRGTARLIEKQRQKMEERRGAVPVVFRSQQAVSDYVGKATVQVQLAGLKLDWATLSCAAAVPDGATALSGSVPSASAISDSDDADLDPPPTGFASMGMITPGSAGGGSAVAAAHWSGVGLSTPSSPVSPSPSTVSSSFGGGGGGAGMGAGLASAGATPATSVAGGGGFDAAVAASAAADSATASLADAASRDMAAAEQAERIDEAAGKAEQLASDLREIADGVRRARLTDDDADMTGSVGGSGAGAAAAAAAAAAGSGALQFFGGGDMLGMGAYEDARNAEADYFMNMLEALDQDGNAAAESACPGVTNGANTRFLPPGSRYAQPQLPSAQ